MNLSTQQESAWRRTVSFVHESLRDSDKDYTTGHTGRALGLLAIPMMLEMSMESVFAVVDIAFVSRLGTDAIAAVGITEALITVLYAVAVGLGMGVTAMVSRRVGAQRRERAASATGQAIWIGAALSLVIGISGVIYAEEMLRLMGASDGVIDTGAGFAAVLLGGSASILYLFLLNAAFRGAGDASVALRSLWLANGLNIVLDPCLIFGLGPFPEMGVTGAAVATTIGRGIGVLYQLWYLFDGRGRLEFHLRNLVIEPSLIARMLIISVGGVGQFLIATTSWIIIVRIIALYGSTAIAAYTIALRMLEFVWLPAWGLGNAAATLVGQNLGAGKPDRAESSAWQASRYNVIFMTGMGALIVALAPVISGLFSNDPEVVRYGSNCLRILGLGFPMYAVGMIITQSLNGAGDTSTPTVINIVCFWLLQIPLAYWLATQFLLGPNGVFLAIIISESLMTGLSVIVFRRGAWKHHRA
ncbi:MAG: MATE family efflux transporter [Gammaproteobacteria bacterium]|nr:MATE family efflux transporter [Gammaproteobacteria bacterium]MDH3372776.1 MATE family efflux transporter [Gammaproteobacteria bacterium]MDH3408078.1 MATE family efflux transporter [Gammaproteobacteria bacterium]MDH3551633.1 MATE family efflux transporter [Gammaproteobacteria bacterium]